MKKLIQIFVTLVFVSVAVSANAQTKLATIIGVDTNYVQVYTDVPTTECQNVEVPIYGNTGNGQFSNDGAIIGGIVGGLLGNTVGNGSGKEAATGVGALAGAIIGGKRNQPRSIVGYKLSQQCHTVNRQQVENRIKNYTITYEWNGIQARSYTYNQYSIGDTVPVTISINAN